MLNKILNSKLFSFTHKRDIKLLILIGVLYRLILFLTYLHSNLVPDSSSFMELGNLMLECNLECYNGKRSPGYPLFYILALGSTKLTIIYQFIIGVFTSVFLYKTLCNLNFTSKNSVLIAFFCESFLNVFIYETSFLIETLSLFLLTIIFYILSNDYFNKQSWRLELLMTSLLTFLVLIKPFFAFIPFIIYGFCIVYKFKSTNFLTAKIIILIFPVIAYFGWSYINKINTEYFVSTTYFGLNLSQNCVYFAERGPEEYRWIIDPYVKHRNIAINENKDVAMSIWYAYNEGEFDYKNLSFPDLSNELGKFAKQTIAANQKEYWHQVVFKSWADFWNVFDISEFKKFRIFDDFFKIIWTVQKAILIIFKIAFLLLIPFYFYKFIKFRRISFELITVSIIWATSILQAIVTYGTNAKYSFPFEYLMIIVVLLFLKNNVKLPRFLSTFLQ